MRALLVLALLCLGAAPAAAQRALESYADCVDYAAESPQQALAAARAWKEGGVAGRHCAAVALLGLGRYAEAAQGLTEVAAAMADQPAERRAALLAQAGQAWMLAGAGERSRAAFDAALELRPGDPEMLLDRAIARMSDGQAWEALDDLNRAAETAPGRPDILVLRASTYRRIGSPDLARDDVERALAIDPNNPDALLERGILRADTGDRKAARADWERVVRLAPGSPAADVARANLDALDLTGG